MRHRLSASLSALVQEATASQAGEIFNWNHSSPLLIATTSRNRGTFNKTSICISLSLFNILLQIPCYRKIEILIKQNSQPPGWVNFCAQLIQSIFISCAAGTSVSVGRIDLSAGLEFAKSAKSLEILHIPDSGRVYALPAPRLSQLRHRVVEDITIPQMRKSWTSWNKCVFISSTMCSVSD